MVINVLIENTVPEENPLGLKNEHGLSLFVHVGGRSILFDTGASSLFLKNARKLDLYPETAEWVVLSHGHYDHGGGLSALLKKNRRADVICGPGITGTFRSKKKTGFADAGLSRGTLRAVSNRMKVIDRNTEIAPGIYVFPVIEHPYPLPLGNRTLFRMEGNTPVPDNFPHEISAVLITAEGLIVLTGCAHNGLLNILHTAAKLFPGKPIISVIGGFHLRGIPEENKTLNEFARTVSGLAPAAHLYTGHCTADSAYTVLKDVLKGRLGRLHTGLTINI